MNSPKTSTVYAKVTAIGDIDGQSFKQVALKDEAGARHLAIVNTTVGADITKDVVGSFTLAQYEAGSTEYVDELGAISRHKQSNTVIISFLLES
jgi:hypothetical protein